MGKKSIRSSNVTKKFITITAVGLSDKENKKLEEKNRAIIRLLNHCSEEKITYQLIFV